ncbi:MAG: hypothetical protein WA783_04630 [Phormidesmis sp.]
MLWLFVIAIALTSILLGKHLSATDEIYALACYITGGFSGLLGFAIAPSSAQFILELFTLGSVQAGFLRS